MSATSLDALFRSCRRELERFFRRRVGSAEAAADLTQEAFLRLLRAGAAGAIENPRAYLFRTAGNLVADHYRAAGAEPAGELGEAGWQRLAAAEPSAERAVLSREELAVLRRAIGELTPRERQVFLLHKFEQLSYAEVAERLGIAKNTVVVHMVRALGHCKRRLDAHRRGGDGIG